MVPSENLSTPIPVQEDIAALYSLRRACTALQNLAIEASNPAALSLKAWVLCSAIEKLHPRVVPARVRGGSSLLYAPQPIIVVGPFMLDPNAGRYSTRPEDEFHVAIGLVTDEFRSSQGEIRIQLPSGSELSYRKARGVTAISEPIEDTETMTLKDRLSFEIIRLAKMDIRDAEEAIRKSSRLE